MKWLINSILAFTLLQRITTMNTYDLVIPEKRGQLQALGMTVAQRVRDYFKSPTHRKAFEAWYMEKYSKPYKWERVKGS